MVPVKRNLGASIEEPCCQYGGTIVPVWRNHSASMEEPWCKEKHGARRNMVPVGGTMVPVIGTMVPVMNKKLQR